MARGYADMADAFGGPQGLLQYLMLKDGLYERLAESNAKAVHGMQPKINVWNGMGNGNGGAGSDGDTLGGAIRGIYQNLPPLLDTVHQQPGMTPPSWLMQGVGSEQGSKDGKMQVAKQDAMVNGEKQTRT